MSLGQAGADLALRGEGFAEAGSAPRAAPDCRGFGRWLAAKRKSLDLTRDELAELVHCATPTLRKIETGERRASKDLAARLAAALGVEAAERAAFVAFARARAAMAAHSAGSQTGAADSSDEAASRPALGLPEREGPGPLGRRREVAEVADLVLRGDCRLLTLTGLGGVGKSLVAREAAASLHGRASRELLFLDLAEARSAQSRGEALRSAIGAGEEAADRASGGHEPLLVLDNIEAEGEVRALLAGFLARKPGTKLLCTSRGSLGLGEEWVYRIHGLAEGPEGAGDDCAAAVELFVERLRRFRPLGPLDRDKLSLVRRICRALGGHPLALEMAARWARALPLEAVTLQVEDEALGLTIDRPDCPARQTSLLAILEDAWTRLEAEERGLISSLARLEGEFTLEEAIEAGRPYTAALAVLIDDAYLVSRGSGRYELCALMRSYARRT